MKKALYIISICFLVLILSISMYFNYYQRNELAEIENYLQNEDSTYPEIYDKINSVSYNNFESFLENAKNTKTIVYLGRPTCSDCTLFEPALIEFINTYNLSEKIIYLNVAEIRQDEKGWEAFKMKYNLKYTPTVAIFENSEVISKVEWTPEGGITINAVKEWFESNNIL